MRTPIAAACSALLLAGCFMPASIQNRVNQREAERVRAEAAAQWQRLDADAASRGWRPVGEPRQGLLQETYNESDDLAITLPATGEYNVVGFCLENCIDMDFVVYDAARQRVTQDIELDATPIVAFRGRAGERYNVRVTIPDCRVPRGSEAGTRWQCMYFARVYTR